MSGVLLGVRVWHAKYGVVGALKPEEQQSEEQHIQDLQATLQKIPRVHLIVLDTIVKHLKE